MNAQQAWDAASAAYQARQQIPTDDVYFTPFGHAERDLQLLGNVRGLRILDLGCGGGQAAIALAKAGARVTGVDFSSQQLAFARQLAADHGVTVNFVLGEIAELEAFVDGSFDLILSLYTLQYLPDPLQCLHEVNRLLTHNGRLIISLDHPIHNCFFDPDEDEFTPYPSHNYFSRAPLSWTFPETKAKIKSYHYTISLWIDFFQRTGLQLRNLLEPSIPSVLLDDLWPLDTLNAPLRDIPHAIIFAAWKP
jgi:ubiquinone/menaquinone biosynthesis C-methylase UbiE